jgi:hypothetical protein
MTEPQRMNHKRTFRPIGELERVESRRVQALNARIAGGSYRAIAKQLGVNQATVFRDVQVELARLDKLKRKLAERARDIEVQRCDAATLALQERVRRGEPNAVRAAMVVSERRSKLLGLDAPDKVLHAGMVVSEQVIAESKSSLDAKLADLQARMLADTTTPAALPAAVDGDVVHEDKGQE